MNRSGHPSRRGTSSKATDNDTADGSTEESVGSLLAVIANSINDALRLLMFADKAHWGPDEFEQVRALEHTLDEAKKDFQEMGPLLKGSVYYENDRRLESLDELGDLRTEFENHAQVFKDWLRQGGPIEPLWVNDTVRLRRELHRAQCRAAARIFASQQADIADGPGQRCLGAFEVYRRQRRLDDRRKQYEQQQGGRTSRYESTRDEVAQAQGKKPKRIQSWEQQTPVMGTSIGEAVEMGHMGQQKAPSIHYSEQLDAVEREAELTEALEELVPVCSTVGHFERFGDRDVGFECDFCEGFIVWNDLMVMPTKPDPSAVAKGVTEQPNWQSRGKSVSTGEDKTVVFAPLAIANHLAPEIGGWQARILCPYCDDYNYFEQGEGDETRYAQDERGFGSLDEFQAHLEWHHTSTAMPSLPSAKNCVVM
ncbi:hypothetical protein INS49_014591 [Diaporthe citri]|uniref:uncharacterized protein n=1 Tax=Diaporthe citri TaxID=83186 RepID=UPI001C813326|nr:uncharacterized protein INS49_014591 [Diaporthe citri]KAG6356717.1 hypothetical protein INS49_014591 [Diaporthe citri]